MRVPASDAVADRARALERLGLRGLDALHVAPAEAGGADLLITTDDRIIRRAARVVRDLHVRLVTPPEAVVLLPRRPSR
jgi:predicted nucleic acid-binding protein